MLVELVAGRILSRHVGTSLYSWTSVIGVVLGGITVGNLAGGWLADLFPARRLLAVLFVVSGAAALSVPVLDHYVAEWSAWNSPTLRSWPLRVSFHVTLVFLVPATALGLIGPVVAKAALDRGTKKGRTVGNVYAWGALGSIVGTFATGYFLIATFGSMGTSVLAAIALILVGILLSPGSALRLLVVTWPILFALLFGYFRVTGSRYREWVWEKGRPVIEERPLPGCRYVKESLYSFIRVGEDESGKILNFYLDNLLHSAYMPTEPTRIEYGYEKTYGAITQRYAGQLEKPKALFVGGGGYIFPRWMQALWPQSIIDVVEIDPAVTEANFAAFGLLPEQVRILGPGGREMSARQAGPGIEKAPSPKSPRPIDIYHLDARNHVEDLVRQKRADSAFVPFDFVYGDAFNDFSVPFHLVTVEFAEKIRFILRPRTGIYLINVIDMYSSGRFLGAVYNTLGQVFDRVYVFSTSAGEPDPASTIRDTFVVIATFEDLDLTELGRRKGEMEIKGAQLGPKHLEFLKEKSRGMVLTDDYSPVENLLKDVVRMRAQD